MLDEHKILKSEFKHILLKGWWQKWQCHQVQSSKYLTSVTHSIQYNLIEHNRRPCRSTLFIFEPLKKKRKRHL